MMVSVVTLSWPCIIGDNSRIVSRGGVARRDEYEQRRGRRRTETIEKVNRKEEEKEEARTISSRIDAINYRQSRVVRRRSRFIITFTRVGERWARGEEQRMSRGSFALEKKNQASRRTFQGEIR